MKKQRELQVHVESLAESGQRFVEAWKRLENGERIHENHMSFESEALKAASDPFAVFDEWSSRSDRRAYQRLKRR